MRTIVLLILAALSHIVVAQQHDSARVHSYASYDDAAIEDNSFLMEEAFNQDMGVLQHISVVTLDKVRYSTLQYSFTQEIPLTDQTHQLSYTLIYSIHPTTQIAPGNANGFGDLSISYRPQLFGKNDWLMLIPRFSVIVPTGNAAQGLGSGGWGAQFNLAATKRLSRTLTTHANAGFTHYFGFDHYNRQSEQPVLSTEKNLWFENVGASIVWQTSQHSNILMEGMKTFGAGITDDGKVYREIVNVINPGVRFCLNLPKMQVVPGLSFPTTLVSGNATTGVLFYLSIETSYRN